MSDQGEAFDRLVARIIFTGDTCVRHRLGHSLRPINLANGQDAIVRARTTFGAGCCIACQRS